MIRFYIVIILSIIFFAFYVSAQWSSKTPNRELVIILNNHNEESEETIEKTFSTIPKYESMNLDLLGGIGALSITALIAINQEAAPMLISSCIIENIVKHKKLLSDFMNLTDSALSRKYKKYPRFSSDTRRKKFKNHASYIKKVFPAINEEIKNKIKNKNNSHVFEELCKIAAKPEFNVASAPAGLNHLVNNEVNQVMYCEMVIYTICHNTQINNDKWFIKKVSEDLYLFIPKNYFSKISKNIDASAISEFSNNKSLTNLEIQLGLQLNHLENIENIEEYILTNKKLKNTHPNNSWINDLAKLFVQNSELKSKEIPIWSIYFAGHGFPVSSVIAISEQLEKLRTNYVQEINQTIYKNCLDCEKNKNSAKHHKHIVNCKYHREFKEINLKLKKLDQEIKKISTQKNYLQDVHKGIICSLSLDDFQKMLLFLNDNITTAFLYYTSCFSGGDHLTIPYNKNRKPLIFNYPIVSGTLAENMSIQEMPAIKIPPYNVMTRNGKKVVHGINYDGIDFKKKSLKLVTTLQFKKFFKALRNNSHHQIKNFPKLIYKLHPYTTEDGKIRYECLANVPHVRLSGQDKFQIIPGEKAFITITPEYVQNNKVSPAINLTDIPALLYADYIPQKVTMDVKGQFVPPCISMIPGLAAHTFEEISAPNFSLAGIANAFLFFPEFSGCKAFWIKKLRCKHTQTTAAIRSDNPESFINLNDVIITRNIFNSHTLQRCSPRKQTPMDTCIYLTSDKNKSYRVTWRGPELNLETLNVNPVDSQEYKSELMAYYPNLKQHVQNKSRLA